MKILLRNSVNRKTDEKSTERRMENYFKNSIDQKTDEK